VKSVKSLIFGGVLAASTALATADNTGLKVLETIPVGGPGGWDYPALDSSHHILYLSHGNAVASIDLGSKAVNSHLADAQGAHVALPVRDGALLLVTNGKTNQVTLNDPRTGAVLATIPTDPGPDAAIVEPVTGKVFVMANHGTTVNAIDLEKRAVVGKVSVGGAPEAAAVDGRGLVFTHLEDKNAIVVIDVAKMVVKAHYDISDCDEPSGIAFVAAHRWILSACKNGKARITAADSGAEVATVPIGEHPDFAAVDEQRHLGFIPCGDGTLTVIQLDVRIPTVLGVLRTHDGARSLALDPNTGTLYLPAADFGQASVPGERRPIIPDSFRVVVVGR
jgi:DNA-binding beta-propeller fold protein YncE